jgi:aminopeptidase
LTIETWNNGLDFAKEVVKQARRVGAIPLLILEDEEAYLDGLRSSPKDSLGKMGKHEYSLLSGSDAYVFIPGPPLAVYSPTVPREDSIAATSYNSSWYESAEKANLRGVRMTFGYIGRDYAKLLGKSQEEITDRQVRAALTDFQSLRERGTPIMGLLQDGAEAEIETGTNRLSFRLSGELGIEDGIVDESDVASSNNISNMLPGMIWKEVEPTSVSGTVKISPSVSRLGIVEESNLEFDAGKLVRWNSKDKKSKGMLDTLIQAIPEDKRVFSILSLGLNPVIKYGYAQDRLVNGSIGLAGFGLTAIARTGTLKVGSKTIVKKGKIESNH